MIRTPTRTGFVMPVVVILGLLMGISLIAFHFASSGDYALVHRMLPQLKMTAIADVAADELRLKMLKTVACPKKPGDPEDPFEDPVNEFKKGRVCPQKDPRPIDKIDIKQIVEDKNMTLTNQLAQLAGATAGGTVVKLTVGPMTVIPAPQDAKTFYAEETFKDRDQQDLVPWHMRGPVEVELKVKLGGSTPTEETVKRNFTLAVSDVSPPASEFALCSYLPPESDDDALNGLQRGGRLTVNPSQAGRIMVRGPYLFMPEDGADPANPPLDKNNKPLPTPALAAKDLGDGTAPARSISYPESQWAGWSAVPGPRALQLSGLDPVQDAKFIIDKVVQIFVPTAQVFGDPKPVRPAREGSRPITIGPIPIINLTYVTPKLSIIFGVKTPMPSAPGTMPTAMPGVTPGVWWPLFGDDQVATFAPNSYFHGPLAAGKQTFSVIGDVTTDTAASTPPLSRSMFRGVVVDKDGKPKSPYDGAFPIIATGTFDQDSIVAEPVARGDTGDCGILTLAGIAKLKVKDYFSVNIFQVFTGPMAVIFTPINLLMSAIGAPGLYFVFRNWDLEDMFTNAPALDLTKLTVDDLGKMFTDEKALLLPFGLHTHAHKWSSVENLASAISNYANQQLKDFFSFNYNGISVSGANFFDLIFRPPGTDPTEVQKTFDNFVESQIQDKSSLLNGIYGAVRGASQWCSDRVHDLAKTLNVDLSTLDRVMQAVAQKNKTRMTRAWSMSRGPVSGFFNEIFGVLGPVPPDAPGAFDPLKLVGPERMGDTAAEFPNGFTPAKVVNWAAVATRTYPDFETFLKKETIDGVLPLRGVVLIKKADYQSSEPITYKNKGIIVVATGDAAKPAKLAVTFKPETAVKLDATPPGQVDWLILVHQVSADILQKASDNPTDVSLRPALQLGESVTGTVYSDTGVAPVGSKTAIVGNLVTGNINKQAIKDTLNQIHAPDQAPDGVSVLYVPNLKGCAQCGTAANWTVELLADASTGP